MMVDPKYNTSRRSFIIKASAACAILSLPKGAARAEKAGLEPVQWRGAALGAEAVIELHNSDLDAARRVLEKCKIEIDRLEGLFSLYRENSSLVRLNKEGFLENPDIQFLSLLSSAKAFSSKTGGIFDITVQPLWSFYRNYFSNRSNRGSVPLSSDISRILKRVGSEKLYLSEKRVEFKEPEMAITLNGIAQGYITDRIKLILQTEGYTNVLLSLGEITTIGPKLSGQPWKVGLEAGPEGQTSSQKIISLENQAVATSGAYNSPFDGKNGANHLLNPRTGEWSTLKGSVSVISANAMTADMYSTALSLMTEEERALLMSNSKQVQNVYFSSRADGRSWTA